MNDDDKTWRSLPLPSLDDSHSALLNDLEREISDRIEALGTLVLPDEAACIMQGLAFEVGDVDVLLTCQLSSEGPSFLRPRPPHLLLVFFDRRKRRPNGWSDMEVDTFHTVAMSIGTIAGGWFQYQAGRVKPISATFLLQKRLPVLERAIMRFMDAAFRKRTEDRGYGYSSFLQVVNERLGSIRKERGR